MLTIFHIFVLIGFLTGGGLGIAYGLRFGGVPGGVVGALVGAIFGQFVGRAPLVLSLAWLRRSLQRSDNVALRKRLDREYYISYLIIAELTQRGEPAESFTEVIKSQLRSPSPDVQRFGRMNARIWCPDLVEPAEPKF